MSLPDDKSVVFYAYASRLAGDSHESYFWLAEVPSDAKRVNLSNDNLYGDTSGAAVLGSGVSAEGIAEEAHKLAARMSPKPTPVDPGRIIYLTAATTARDNNGGQVALPRGTRLILISKHGAYLSAEYNGQVVEVPTLYTNAR